MKKIAIILLTYIIVSLNAYSKDVLSPKDAERIIADRAMCVMLSLKHLDAKTFVKYVHPVKKLRFTYHTYVTKKDAQFSRNELLKDWDSNIVFQWGVSDGQGAPIHDTLKRYIKDEVFSKDFVHAEQVAYNTLLHSSNIVENYKKYYPNAIMVQYYVSPVDSKHPEMDWASRRLFFEEYQNKWYLVGIINDFWAI